MSIDRSEPVQRTLHMYAQLLEEALSHEPPAESTKFLIERFQNPQIFVLSEFEDADTHDALSRAEDLVEALLHTHADMWKSAVEHSAQETLDSLRSLLSDIYQFREYEYASPPPGTELTEARLAEENFDQKKQYLANRFRRRVEELRFASYGWAVHLYTEGDLLETSIEPILEGPLMQDFGSIRDMSDVFFRMRESDTILDIWEQWNMDREMENNFGAAVTGMAANTWLLKFYCSALIWIISKDDSISVESLNAEDSPILDYSERAIHIDPVIDTIESYKEEYPLQDLLDDGGSRVNICDDLIGYFEEVKEVFEEHERDWTRRQPIDDAIVRRFEEKVNSQVNSNTFRRAILNTNGINESPSIDEEQLEGFSVSGRLPRRAFVDTGIQTFFNNNFSRVLDGYREFVIEELDFVTEKAPSNNSIPGLLEKIISEYEVEVILTGEREAANVLRNHEKSNRISNQNLNSYLEYSGVPVLNDVGADYLAIAWFSNDYEYRERSVAEPVSVSLDPGEEVPEWNESDVPEGFNARDWVKVTFAYEALIASSGQNGIILQR